MINEKASVITQSARPASRKNSVDKSLREIRQGRRINKNSSKRGIKAKNAYGVTQL
jgi:hypothetical protein